MLPFYRKIKIQALFDDQHLTTEIAFPTDSYNKGLVSNISTSNLLTAFVMLGPLVRGTELIVGYFFREPLPILWPAAPA